MRILLRLTFRLQNRRSPEERHQQEGECVKQRQLEIWTPSPLSPSRRPSSISGNPSVAPKIPFGG